MMSFTKISLESSISLQSNQIHLLITKKWLSSQMFHPLQVNAKWYTEIKKKSPCETSNFDSRNKK